MKYIAGSNVEATFSKIKFPHPELVAVDVIGGTAGPFFFLGTIHTCKLCNFVFKCRESTT